MVRQPLAQEYMKLAECYWSAAADGFVSALINRYHTPLPTAVYLFTSDTLTAARQPMASRCHVL